MSSAFIAIVKDEGPVGLFKGMMPNYAKVVPAGAFVRARRRRGPVVGLRARRWLMR